MRSLSSSLESLLIKKYKQLIINNSYLDEQRFNEKKRELLSEKTHRETALGF